MTVEPDTDIRSRVLARIESKPEEVWTPGDFADLGARRRVQPCSACLLLKSFAGSTGVSMAGRGQIV